ncbi:MAG: NAD(P)-dependent oxidoreductase [Candidatus Zixiibacteriota bacterium]
MLILISDSFHPSLPDCLRPFGEITDDKSRAAEAEVILVRSKTKVTRDYIDNAPKLRLVIRGGVGLDNIDTVYAKDKGIAVHNTAEASTTAVAELTFALMIGLANQVIPAHQSMTEGQWIKGKLKRVELNGRTLGILGMGRIGTSLAIRARAFRMRILAWHPDVFFSDFAEIRDSLTEVLHESDFLTMHMPLLDSTRGIINKERLAECKDGTFMVNVGRGQCVVEQDVADALRSGKLAGYATDVWNSDPPENSPLVGAPNTILTPHIGASTTENMLRIGSIIEKLIGDYVERQKISTS